MDNEKNITTEEQVSLGDCYTVIQAATRLEKAPQSLYLMLRNGKVPSEHIVAIQKPGGKMQEILKPSFFEWFESRGTARVGANHIMKAEGKPTAAGTITTDSLLMEMAAKLEATGNKKFSGIAEALFQALSGSKGTATETVAAPAVGN